MKTILTAPGSAYMKATTRTYLSTAVICLALFALPIPGYSLGSDYPKGQPVGESSLWPKGLSDLANATNRVHGFFVNAEDVFFFAGSPGELGRFLQRYSEISGIVEHKLVVHPEKGVAKSPWDAGTGVPCNWKVVGDAESWKTGDPSKKGYVLEVHVYLGEDAALEKVPVPKTVTVVREK
jgi:hypothetical protein